MIKKLLMVITMLVLLLAPVSAFSFLPKIYGIRFNQEIVIEENPTCINKQLFTTEIEILNSFEPVLEGLEAFEDGYHIIHLKAGKFYGYDYYTVLKEDGMIAYIKPGYCATNDDFHKYTVNADLYQIEQKALDSKTDYVKEGYKLIRSIDGISIGQVFHVLRTAIKYAG